jgi:predicted alpha/beta-hydrolase family hydrolase
MTEITLLHDGPPDGPVLVLAHGAGAPMDSRFMNTVSAMIAAHGIHVVRFEFAYMAARRHSGTRKPPSRMPVLLEELRSLLALLPPGPVFIGGKSMGGRAATMLAAEAGSPDHIAGVVCLGYPFHPPGKPDKMRTAHLPAIKCPVLIVQGERDAFGTRAEVAGWDIPNNIDFHWAPQGNHDLVPPKRSGLTDEDNWSDAARAIAAFVTAHHTARR